MRVFLFDLDIFKLFKVVLNMAFLFLRPSCQIINMLETLDTVTFGATNTQSAASQNTTVLKVSYFVW